ACTATSTSVRPGARRHSRRARPRTAARRRSTTPVAAADRDLPPRTQAGRGTRPRSQPLLAGGIHGPWPSPSFYDETLITAMVGPRFHEGQSLRHPGVILCLLLTSAYLLQHQVGERPEARDQAVDTERIQRLVLAEVLHQ